MQVPEYVYGAIAPTFTVFKDDGSLDDAGQRSLLDFMLESGAINAFFIRSGMGQMYTFDLEDTKQLARTACAHLKGKAPALIGCSGVWDRNYDRLPDPEVYERQAVELSRYAEDLGADGVVHTIPEGLLPAPGQSYGDFIVAYFQRICAAVSCPVLFYQPPKTREEYCLSPETLAQLAEIDNLIGGKVSTNDAYYLFVLIRAVKERSFGFIAGSEMAFYAALFAGANACIGQGTTVNPQIIRSVQDRFLAGDFDGAIEAQQDTIDLVRYCPNAVDFLKRYACEKGYEMGLASRSMASNPYMQDRAPMTEDEYTAYKKRYETTVAKYR